MVRIGALILALSLAAAAQPRPNLEYAGGLFLDFYPSTQARSPLVIFVHGGGWAGGTKMNLGLGARELGEAGFAVASVEYRLVPRATWPSQLEDVKCAVRYLRSHAAELGVDPRRFGIWGESAGGHLAALVGLVGPQAGYDGGDYPGVSSAVQAVADLYGPSDLTVTGGTTAQGETFVRNFLGGHEELKRPASPVSYVTAGAPPFLIMHGEDDRLVPLAQSQELAERLRAAGDQVTLVRVSHAGHNFSGQPEPGRAELAHRLVEFFRAALSQS